MIDLKEKTAEDIEEIRKAKFESWREHYRTPTYIGDSVYVHFDGYHLVLETRNGMPTDPSNSISIEPEVLKNLLEFNERLNREYDSI